MSKITVRGARPLMACVSTLALVAMVPALALAQSTDVGGPGKALTAGTVTSTTGMVTDGGANGGVTVVPGANDTVTVDNAVINNATSAGLNVGNFSTPVTITLSGSNTIAGGSGIIVSGSGSATLDMSAGGSAITGGAEVFSSGGDVRLVNGANTFTATSTPTLQAFVIGGGTATVDSVGGAITTTGPVITVQSGTGTGGGNVVIGEGSGLTTAMTTTNASNSVINADTSGTGSISITTGAGGTIDGGYVGIEALTGTGSITINTGAAIGSAALAANSAILAQGSGSITINAAASLASSGTVVSASTGGTSDLTISTTGVTSANVFGVFASLGGQTASGTLTYTLNGANTISGTEGVFLTNAGAGLISISAADAGSAFVGTTFDGIDARATGTGGINVAIAGTASGASNGVSTSATSGATSISTGGAVSGVFGGIDASASNGGAITINTIGAVSAVNGAGINASSTTASGAVGGGAVTLGSAGQRLGSVTSTNGIGIYAAGAGDVSVYASSVSGVNGVQAASQAGTGATPNGAVVVDVSGPVVASNGSGVMAFNDGVSAANTTTVTTGAVTSTNGTAIVAAANAGDVLINANGAVTVNATPNSYWDGIYAASESSTSDLNVTINATGPIVATYNGIEVNTVGASTKGAITINASGTINSIAGGVLADGSGAGAINIGTASAPLGAVTVSNGYGVLASGQGDIDIYTGAVTSTGGAAASFTGNVSNGAVNANVTHQGVLTPGTGYAVAAITTGPGEVTVNTGGAVTGGAAGGILAQATSGSVSVTTQAVTAGAGAAIEADTTGGAISVTANGAVSGASSGIVVSQTNTAGTGAITVDATSTVDSASNYAIAVRNAGTGAVSLGAADARLGAVTSTASTGIFATSPGDISVYATDVTGGTRGIVASSQNAGADGAVVVDASGTVTAGAGSGIIAQTFGAAAKDTVTVRANAVTSTGGTAVSVEGQGGDISVTTTGAIVANPGNGELWDGIFAQNDANANVIVNASGPVTGSFNAIEANAANGAVTVTATGPINGGWGGVVSESDGTGAIALGSANARLGTVTTTSGVGVYASGTSDVSIYTGQVTAVGGAAVTLNSTGQATGLTQANGPNMSTGYGVVGVSTGGDVTIDANGLVTGGAAGGVLGQNLTTAGAVSIATNGVLASVGRGVEADAAGGAIIITANGAISGATQGVFASNSGAGSITILGSGSVTGLANEGIRAIGSDLGAVSIGTASQRFTGAVTGATTGIFAAGAGDVDVYASAVTGGTRGIVAANQGAGAVNGAVVVDVTGPVVGQSSYGIIAVNNGALAANSILVNAGQVTSTNGSAISAEGDGDITINTSGAILANAGTSESWTGIYAAYANGGGDSLITINTTGSVTGSYDGIEADSLATTARSGIEISTGGSVSAGIGSAAILATIGGTGSVSVSTAAGTTLSAAGADGILASATATTGSNNISIANLADIGSMAAPVKNGIEVQVAAGNGGNIAISSAGVINAANAGILAVTAGSGSINIGGANGVGGTIASANAGIYASTTSGDVTITTAAGGRIAGRALVGVEALTNTGGITLNLNGNIGSTSTGDTVGLGVDAQIASGSADININVGGGIYVTPGSGQQSAGILALNGGTGAIHVTSTGVIDPGAYGVVIQGGGAVSYTGTGGSISGAQGLYLASTGAGAVTLSTAKGSSIIGTAGDGVDVSSQGGALNLAIGGNTSGTGMGVVATTTGAGATTLAITGSVTSAAGPAVVVAAGTGGLNLNVNGNVVSASGPAINATSAGAATVTIGANAVIAGQITTANTAVINLATASGQSSTINVANGAVVESASGSVYDVAIRATGGSVTVNNSGTIAGRVDFSALTGSNSGTLTSSATSTFVTGGTSTFGAGNDTYTNVGTLAGVGPVTTFDFLGGVNVFNNSGTVEIGFNPVLGGGSTFVMKSLTTFNNSGTLQMANGVLGDSIVMAGANYIGSGAAMLSVDTAVGAPGAKGGAAAATGPLSDTLVVGSSSGVTSVVIHDTTTGYGAYNPAGVLIVVGNTHKGDFVLGSGSSYYNPNIFGGAIDKPGLFFSQLAVTPAGTALISAPKVQAYQFATLPSQVEALWYATAAKTDRQADLRDQLAGVWGDRSDGHTGFWAKIDADTASRDVTQTYATGNAAYSYDASYRQDIGEMSFGYDGLQRDRAGVGGFAYGLYGSYVTADTRFDVDSTRTRFSGWSLNGYGSYVGPGGLYASGNVGGEWLRAKLQAPDLTGYTEQHSDISIYGASGEAGVRRPFLWGSTLEPNVGASYMHADIDSVASAGAGFLYNDPDSLRLSLGARMSGDTGLSAGQWRTRYALSLKAVDDVLASNRMTLASAGPDLQILDGFGKAFGEMKASLTGDSRDGWSVSGGLRYRWNDHYNEEGVTASVRLRF